MELGGCLCPASAGTPRGGDYDPAVLSMQLDFATEAGVLEEGLRDADALRVANGDDAGFDGTGARHGRYNVSTDGFADKDRRSLLTRSSAASVIQS
jgi:hypothetical protein